METYLAVFTGSADSPRRAEWDELPDRERQSLEQQGIAAWGGWMSRHEARIVHAGGPLGATKRVSREGITDVTNPLAGFVVVQAESHEAAARLFENHPHFAIFPGEAVEIMPLLPIPEA